MDAKIPSSQLIDSSRWLRVVAWVLYLAYLLVIWSTGAFDSTFWRVDWWIVSKACVVVIPIYILVIHRLPTKFFLSDLWFVSFPFLLWFLLIALVVTEKSLFNAVVEPGMIIIASGLFLLVAPISSAVPSVSRWKICLGLSTAIALVTCAIATFVPILPE